MSVTTRLKDSTIDVIHELVENNYQDADIYEFINTYGEDALETCYEDYVELGETYSFEAVDVFCDEFSIEDIGNFQDAYYGEYETPAIFAENFTEDTTAMELPNYVVVDWEATWECNLRHDFIWSEGFVFNRNFWLQAHSKMMTLSEDKLQAIKENYASLILDGMDMRSLEAFAMESILQNMEMWDEKDIKEEVLDYYGEETWNDLSDSDD